MKNTNLKKPLFQSAIEILIRELGPRKTSELWHLLSLPRGDYLKIRQKLFKKISLKQLYKKARKFNR